MATNWGSTHLNIIRESYQRGAVDANINEIKLIPGDTNTDPSSNLQSGGRTRRTFAFSGVAFLWADYEGFYDDYIAQEERTFEDGEYSLTCIIKKLSGAKSTIDGLIEYNMELIEV